MDAISRQKSLMAAAGAVIAMLGLVGCEKMQGSSTEADRAAVADMVKGQLDAAAGEKGAASEIRTTVHSKLSTQRYAEGVDAYSKVLDARLDATRLGWRATQLASLASENLDSAGDLQKYDPAPSLLKADETIGNIRGASDKMTRTVAGVEMPTLTAVDANIEKLNADIASVQKQVADLTVDQQRLTQQAAEAEVNAKELKGQKAVDAYRQAADATKQASDTAVKIELAEAKLVPLQQDLAVAQEQNAVLTAAVAQVDSLKAKLNLGWDAVGAERGNRTKIAETLIGKSPQRNRVNLVTTVKDIETIAHEGEKALDQSETAFKAAVDSAHEASAAASQTGKQAKDRLPASLGTSQEAILKKTQKMFNPNSLKVSEYMNEFSAARVYADQAALFQTRENALTQLARVADRVNYSVPADLLKAAKVEADRKEAANKAATSLKNVDENLDTLDKGLLPAEGAIKQTVAVGRMMTLLSSSEVAQNMGEAAMAKSYLDDAKGIRDAMPADAKLPQLPAPLKPAASESAAPTQPVQPEAPTTVNAVPAQ